MAEQQVANDTCKRKRKTYYCGHCLRDVSKATYYRHRTEFYDDLLKDWRPSAKRSVITNEDVVYETSSDEDNFEDIILNEATATEDPSLQSFSKSSEGIL
jgi:hypothetical protein